MSNTGKPFHQRIINPSTHMKDTRSVYLLCDVQQESTNGSMHDQESMWLNYHQLFPFPLPYFHHPQLFQPSISYSINKRQL
jgi:hypothetical protein